MKTLSDKYIAGFLDADGSIRLDKHGRLWIEFSQKQSNDGVLVLIHGVLGGSILDHHGSRRGKRTLGTRVVITGKRAHGVLNRLKKHLVVKAQKAEEVLSTLEERPEAIVSRKVHPSRSWLAGYFDGDGMISGAITNSKYGSASIRTSVTSNARELRGLELIQKAFGGVIRVLDNTSRWELTLPASKAISFFSYFAKHLRIKREQAYYVLGCAAMGHFRDGNAITATLKAQKLHPHRLSDLHTEVDVSLELGEVRNLTKQHGQHHGPVLCACGSSDLYAREMCNPCYQRSQYRCKRQSA